MRETVLLRVPVHLKWFIFGNASGLPNSSLELTGTSAPAMGAAGAGAGGAPQETPSHLTAA